MEDMDASVEARATTAVIQEADRTPLSSRNRFLSPTVVRHAKKLGYFYGSTYPVCKACKDFFLYHNRHGTFVDWKNRRLRPQEAAMMRRYEACLSSGMNPTATCKGRGNRGHRVPDHIPAEEGAVCYVEKVLDSDDVEPGARLAEQAGAVAQAFADAPTIGPTNTIFPKPSIPIPGVADVNGNRPTYAPWSPSTQMQPSFLPMRTADGGVMYVAVVPSNAVAAANTVPNAVASTSIVSDGRAAGAAAPNPASPVAAGGASVIVSGPVASTAIVGNVTAEDGRGEKRSASDDETEPEAETDGRGPASGAAGAGAGGGAAGAGAAPRRSKRGRQGNLNFDLMSS